MKKLCLVMIGILFFALPPAYSQNSVALSGTYSFDAYDLIVFTGNNYTLIEEDATYRGSYSRSGNTFTLNGYNGTSRWIRGQWTIVDTNTIKDEDGDCWHKPSTNQTIALSGTYGVTEGCSLTFTGNNYLLDLTDVTGATYSGNYSRSGNTFTLNGATDWWRGQWTIVNANALWDPDGDTWDRNFSNTQQVAQQPPSLVDRAIDAVGSFFDGLFAPRQPQSNNSQSGTSSNNTQQRTTTPSNSSTSRLNNTTWYYEGGSMVIPVPNGFGGYSMSGVVNFPPETIYFGNGNYRWDNETGTYTISGDTVTLTSTTGSTKTGSIIGNSLKIDGGNTFTRIQ